jgi:hypothetical protein
VARQSLLVARTLALSMLCTASGGLATDAICPARRAIRRISEAEYVHLSSAGTSESGVDSVRSPK